MLGYLQERRILLIIVLIRKHIRCFRPVRSGRFGNDPYYLSVNTVKKQYRKEEKMIKKTIESVLCRIGEAFKKAAGDDRGIGVVEVVLILVVLIGLVVIFRDQLTAIVNGIFGRIAQDANGI